MKEIPTAPARAARLEGEYPGDSLPVATFKEAETTLREEGFNHAPTWGHFEVSGYERDAGNLEAQAVIRPDLREVAANLMWSSRAFNHLDVRAPDENPGMFGDSSGSHHVTSNVVHGQMTVAEAIRDLCNRGHGDVGDAVRNVLQLEFDGRDDPEAVAEASRITCYAVGLMAIGWMAEAVVHDSDDELASMSESWDKAGKDLSDGSQLRSAVRGGKTETGKENHCYYQWSGDGTMVLADEAKLANKQAAELAGVNHRTAMYRGNHKELPDGTKVRYFPGSW